MDVFEALYTTRAMRRVKEDPIPDEIIKVMVDAAIRAPKQNKLLELVNLQAG